LFANGHLEKRFCDQMKDEYYYLTISGRKFHGSDYPWADVRPAV